MSPPARDEQPVRTTHLVKGEDLNHHHTLYAGRCVEWCVEMAYVTAQSCFREPRPLVFMSIRSLSMRSAARLGEIIELSGRVDYIGESTIGVRVDGRRTQGDEDHKPVVTGTFLFCTIDDEGKAIAHGLPVPEQRSTASDRKWRQFETEKV
jgi:acyl-CoA hydrolase